MRKLNSRQIGLLVLAAGLVAFAIDYAVGRGGNVTTAGFGTRGETSGFKGTDEELQTTRTSPGSGFKGSDEELQAVTDRTKKK